MDKLSRMGYLACKLTVYSDTVSMKSIKPIVRQLLHGIRRILWSLIVAYMLGIHNFYHGDNKTKDESINTIEVKEDQSNGAPKD